MQVTRSAYYTWLKREPSVLEKQDADLKDLIHSVLDWRKAEPFTEHTVSSKY